MTNCKIGKEDRKMARDFIFSWAENADGRMVHVDDVPRGLQCGCVCPNCREKLVARHGDVKEHGFAHHSDNRGANLNICYQVVMYKLAEQIIQTRKRIQLPSYYGIFRERDVEFKDVRIDSRYEREDKQPDVIATTNDDKQYLIEFVFLYKVQHKHALDYKNLTCLEVDLSNQSLETLERFLLESAEDRKWLNNEDYFTRIDEIYRKAGKAVRVVCESECVQCELSDDCCAVMKAHSPLVIENSGNRYRLCKIELYEQEKEALRLRKKEEEEERQEMLAWQQEQRRLQEERQRKRERPSIDPSQRSCFNCQSNLSWANRDGWANCGCYITLGLPKQRVKPDHAEQCPRFRSK